MASTWRVVNIGCTFLLIVVFTLVGTMKLTPMISPEIHSEMKANFRSFVRVPPIDLLQLEPDIYRTMVGMIELLCAVCLLCPHSRVQLIGHYVLLVLMLGAIWTHYSMNDTVNKFFPALVCLGLLVLRLYACGKLGKTKLH